MTHASVETVNIYDGNYKIAVISIVYGDFD